MAFKMKGNPMKRNFGIGSAMNKKKGSATSAETTTGYKDKDIKKGADKISKSLRKEYTKDELSDRAVRYLHKEHSKNMADIDKGAKPIRGSGKEFYRDEVQKGKMPSKNVKKVNRSKSDIDDKSLKGSKKPNVKQQRELKPRKRK